MNRKNLLLGFIFFTQLTFAQTAPLADLASIKQKLKKLSVLGSVLYVAAHPDDENTRLLAYLAQEKHYRTGYLSLTRGDGGQNLIGNEQGELLGLIRTQELLAARRTDGAEQFFTRANDFGFSKNPEETLKIWNKNKVLADVVWVIRKFRPDVIICRFPTTGEGGHGHHTSSAILAQEAFSAAADPKQFPEQLKFVETWQAKRLLWNTFNFGSTNTTASDQFNINVGVYNPTLGKGYGEIAAESRSNHKSQGFGAARQRGESYEFFRTILGDTPKLELLDGINTSWKRVKGSEEIEQGLMAVIKSFDDDQPIKSVPSLVKLLDKIEKINDPYWKTIKSSEIKKLIQSCAGLWFETYADERVYALNDNVSIRSQIINRNHDDVTLNSISVNNKLDNIGLKLPYNELQSIDSKTTATKITQPYWLESPHPMGTYIINDQQKTGEPENPDALKATYSFTIAGKSISFEQPIVYKSVDPVQGEVYQPLEIAPPVTANLDDNVYLFTDQKPKQVSVALKSFASASGDVRLKVPSGWKVTPESIAFSGKKKGDEWNAIFTVTAANQLQKTDSLHVLTTVNNKVYQLSLRRILYDHIPTITLFPSAGAKLVNLDLKTAGKNIGYITGAGDLVPQALRQIGYQVKILSEEEVMHGDLSVYNAIITGVRAYNVNERMSYEHPKLLEYVKNGGNLVIQYNVNGGLAVNNLGPYPFQMSRERVTDEDAQVTILDKSNPIVRYPNKITNKDFDGWIQERGLYFLSNYDPKYQAILKMNDPGENAGTGSLLVTNYGKGRYVYTSLSFFRQLPAGVPGAYRIFVNLLSEPKK
ncbi:MAG: PIG-L family deacetylase [Sphingobacteriaceae bacterium]